MESDLHWYGERGIVNALVSHLHHHPNQEILVKNLLNSICWADGGRRSWINQIKNVSFVVEVHLGDFGNPDLLLVCRAEEEQEPPHCLFWEAKIEMYRESMMPAGMEQRGFNSSINGQLALKYRFACALAKASPSNGCLERISEDEKIFNQYKLLMKDPNYQARSLVKKEIITDVLSPLGIIGLPLDRFYYVALTWDDARYVFFNDVIVRETPKEGGSYLPRFLDREGKDVFHERKTNIGWIGYEQVEVALKLEDDKSETAAAYRAALKTMMGQSKPDGYEAPKGLERLASVQQSAAKSLADRFVGAKDCQVIKRAGSYSVVKTEGTEQKVVAKIMPSGSTIYVGFRADIDTERTCQLVEKKINGVKFYGIDVNTLEESKRAEESIDRFKMALEGSPL
jgi:hypothetical protein